MLKNNKIITLVIVGIIVIAVIVGLFSYFQRSTAKISQFTVENSLLALYGKGLSKVYIWGVPTGTNMSSSDNILIDIMQVAGSPEGTQRWVAPIPRQPMLLTEIFAIGYDKTGKEVSRVSLPFSGATEINNALWGNAQNNTTTPQGAGQ